METVITVVIFWALVMVVAVPYWRRVSRHQKDALQKYEKSTKLGMTRPVTLHPHINLDDCIGCASCVKVCPEQVLGIVEGKAQIVNGLKCVGHSVCAEVCPVGAIKLGFGTPRQGMEIPWYDDNYQSNVEGLYIIGELGGVGLVKNAIAQGLKAVEHVAKRHRERPQDGYDVVIVGAGPAGLAAALSCEANKLRYVVLEQDQIGGTILHYPRQKLVLTSPVELPLYGKLKVSEISKEDLLKIWSEIVTRFKLNIHTHHKVEGIDISDGSFLVGANGKVFEAGAVLLALGRRGSPRKLGVPGEELPKVMYRLIEAESYTGKHILVVGGGDSAIEAAVGLARQKRNTVMISYRREEFVRLKEKNEKQVAQLINSGKVKAIFNSEVLEIRPEQVFVKEGEKITHQVANDFVFIFAGGELPTQLLKRSGVSLRTSEFETQTKAVAA